MERITVHSQVGDDGILHVDVPIGVKDANRSVQVIIEPTEVLSNRSTDGEYAQWLDGLVGKWQGEFVLDDVGSLESREPLS